LIFILLPFDKHPAGQDNRVIFNCEKGVTMLKKIMSLSAAVVVALSLMVMTGCTIDPTPELFASSRSFGQHRNKHSRVVDNNLRSLWDDMDRILFLDHNMMLSPITMP
jgi:hypothetical protein